MLVQDIDHLRRFWKTPHIESLITGTDGRVRGACVSLHSPAKQRHTCLHHLIQLLYPLEVHSVETQDRDCLLKQTLESFLEIDNLPPSKIIGSKFSSTALGTKIKPRLYKIVLSEFEDDNYPIRQLSN